MKIENREKLNYIIDNIVFNNDISEEHAKRILIDYIEFIIENETSNYNFISNPIISDPHQPKYDYWGGPTDFPSYDSGSGIDIKPLNSNTIITACKCNKEK